MAPLGLHHQACCDLLTEVVHNTGSASLKVTGFSMLPALRPGDVITVERHTLDKLQPGRIILFRRDGRLTAHRIIRASAESLLTQGDSVPAQDLPVQPTEIVGQVVGIHRNGRSVDPQYKLAQRLISSVLRKSDWCTRLFLRLTSTRQHFSGRESTLEH
jgi:signal peptidase I